jgi:hypothetical protein
MEVKPMDKLAKQLKTDAARIEVQVSDELENRIAASLQGVTPLQQKPQKAPQRSALFWWASSLSGVAAALAVIAILNAESPLDAPEVEFAATSPVPEIDSPIIDWKTESAMLTRPLQQELEDLQSDIKKAEEKVKRDVGL